MLNGEDPIAYMMSANDHRRHMTKGQRAMVRAMVFPKPEKGGARQAGVKITPDDVSKAYLSHARTVLAYSPELARSVLAGTEKLDAAYQDAKTAIAARENDTARREARGLKVA